MESRRRRCVQKVRVKRGLCTRHMAIVRLVNTLNIFKNLFYFSLICSGKVECPATGFHSAVCQKWRCASKMFLKQICDLLMDTIVIGEASSVFSTVKAGVPKH